MVILDMDMPQNCINCPLYDGFKRCAINGKEYGYKDEHRPDDCPIVDMPEYINNTLRDQIEKAYKRGYNDAYKMVKVWNEENTIRFWKEQ